jgi:hypothetical protein
VLCTGHRGDVISSYFTNFAALNGDYTVNLASNSVSYHQRERLPDWEVTVAFTGLSTMTGARLARAAERYLAQAEHFGVTYGDGLTDADLAAELRFHLGHDRLGTVLGVQPPSQFGRLALHEDGSASFTEKPRRTTDVVNGGSSSAIRADFIRKVNRLRVGLRGAPTLVPSVRFAMHGRHHRFSGVYPPFHAGRRYPPAAGHRPRCYWSEWSWGLLMKKPADWHLNPTRGRVWSTLMTFCMWSLAFQGRNTGSIPAGDASFSKA